VQDVYCVVYLTLPSEDGTFLFARTIDPNGSLGATILVASAGVSQPPIADPAISKSNNGDEWTVVWEQGTTATNRDIYGARLLFTGAVSVPKFPIDTSASDDRNPSVSTELDGTDRYLVTYERNVGAGNRNIMARFMDGATSLDVVDLSTLEGNSPLADQYSSSVDSDGDHFAIAYTEWVSFPTPDEDVYVATLTPVGNQLRLSEGHRSLSSSSSVDERQVSIAANEGSDGAPGRFIAVWCVNSGGATLRDIEAGLYDAEDFTSFCFPGQAGVLPCPCANPPAAIGRGCNNSAATGGAILSQAGMASIANDTVVFSTTGERPTPLSIVWQSTTLAPAGIQFGQGVRCGTGTLKRLYTKVASGGSITAPQGGDLSVSARSAAANDPLSSGTTRYYFVSYRDPILLGGCSPVFTFNATQTGAITWRP
jgi:hypothetical protein